MSLSLKCKIHNIEYNFVVQGQTFSEEYNETLDSGTVILDHIEKIKNLKPYDDIYIYDKTFEGFDSKGEVIGTCTFFKHFLINQFTEDILNLNKNEYKYKIELFSETKGLETVQLPNISITQPLNINKKISILEYLKKFINMYSPKIKVAINNNEWKYEQKYKLSEDLADYLDIDEYNPKTMISVFGNSYTPDFTLNNPNLRDILSKLMIAKDRIPYVRNNVIYAMDITKRRGEFSTNNVNWISSSRSSANHSDNLRTNYINALSQENTCRNVEFLGFRNSSTALMTLDNMRLETKFPIYKINKIYMCYYKKLKKYYSKTSSYKDKMFLCKQDITPLVKLNSERNLLSEDWNKFHNDFYSEETKTYRSPKSIDEIAKYKLCTVGYDIGSNFIGGWGTKYTFPKGWWDVTKSYVQNIFENMDRLYPFGTYSYNYLLGDEKDSTIIASGNGILDNVISPINVEAIRPEFLDWVANIINTEEGKRNAEDAIKLKSFFFIVDYTAFYNGSIIHTKDYSDSEITMNDNQSSSLALLEIDGLSQKEKINRFGNKGYVIPARYTSIKELQPLGSVLKIDEEDDIIIYHREYSIYENYILCTYYGMNDYVLKNYFTSVYAKHRPYNLMSYSESVYRSENEKIFLFLSKEASYFEKENIKFNFQNLKNNQYEEKLLLNCFEPSETKKYAIETTPENKINYGYFIFGDKKYVTDINCFVSGNSLCFNLKMYDNVSMGNYISDYIPDFNFLNVEDDFTGSVQSWYINVDDKETGFVEDVGIYVCHVDQQEYFVDKVQDANSSIVESVYNKIFELPYIENSYSETNIIGNNFSINKDNKELIDMTFQIEPITTDKNIMFSQWTMKLNDLLSNYSKYDSETIIDDTILGYEPVEFMCSTLYISGYNFNYLPLIILKIPKDKMMDFLKGATFENKPLEYPNLLEMTHDIGEVTFCDKYFCTPIKTKSFYHTNGVATVDIECHLNYEKTKLMSTYRERVSTTVDMPFYKITSFSNVGSAVFDNVNYVYFTNLPIKTTDKIDVVTELAGKIYPEWSLGQFAFLATNNYVTEIEFYQENTILNNNINFLNVEFGMTPLSLTEKKFFQNQFIATSNEEMKKTIVYDEYKYGKFPSNLKLKENIKVNEIFKIEKNEKKESYVYVDLSKFQDEKPSSIQYWYLDHANVEYSGDDLGNDQNHLDFSKAAYKFVFGVNVTQQDYERGYLKIYISILSSMNKKVYDENYQLIGEILNYSIYPPSEIESKTLQVDSFIDTNAIEVYFPLDILNELIEKPFFNLQENGIKCIFEYTDSEGKKITLPGKYDIYMNENSFELSAQKNEPGRLDLPLKKIVFEGADAENIIASVDVSTLPVNIKSIVWEPTTISFSTSPLYGSKQLYTKY